jgi:hypothetical protein
VIATPATISTARIGRTKRSCFLMVFPLLVRGRGAPG